jgi:hypothetical protein
MSVKRAEAGATQEPEGVRLVTVLYSRQRDLYLVPSIYKPVWLSVQVYALPASTLRGDVAYLGAAPTHDGLRWRKAYSTMWRSVLTGERVTVPADDPMVLDYAAYEPPTGESRPRA